MQVQKQRKSQEEGKRAVQKEICKFRRNRQGRKNAESQEDSVGKDYEKNSKVKRNNLEIV